MKRILFLTVGAFLIIGLISAGAFAISQDVEAGTGEMEGTFTLLELIISPTKVDIGQSVTITAIVANYSDKPGNYMLTLKINGMVEETKEVRLGALTSGEVTFTISKDVAGNYSIAVNNLTGSFTVRGEPTPVPYPLVGGIIAAVVVVALLVFFLLRRKAA